MCQLSPGPRCHNDSIKKLDKLKVKLVDAETALQGAHANLSAAERSKDFNLYSKSRKAVSALEVKVEGLISEVRYTQRDVDSTLTGRKHLDEAVTKATTKSELKELDIRRRTGESIRYAREHALQLKQSGYVPAIRFNSNLVAA